LGQLIRADKQSLCLLCIAFYLPADITFYCATLVCTLAKISRDSGSHAYVTNK